MNEWIAIAVGAPGSLALVGMILSRLLDNSAEHRKELLKRVVALEEDLRAAQAREQELADQIHALSTQVDRKQYEMSLLQAQHDNLNDSYRILLERYNASEHAYSKLMQVFMDVYGDDMRERMTTKQTNPGFKSPQPHMVKPDKR